MNEGSKLVLYVGPTVAGDRALQKSLAEMQPGWGALFVGLGRDALGQLKQNKFDAVVSDGTLPDMDGVELLNQTLKHDSGIRRLGVLDLSGKDGALTFMGTAHHLVAAPWSAESIRGALERVFALKAHLGNQKALALMARVKRVPSPPEIYFKIAHVLCSPTADVDDVARIIVRDLAITAKLLQLANSAAMGLRSRVGTVHQAIQFLGLDTVRSLVLLAHTFSFCEGTRVAGFSLEQLWDHSLSVGSLARSIAQAEKMADADEAFLAGLLHDFGKLLLAANLEVDYAEALQFAEIQSQPHWVAELDHFGATHADIGAELLTTWNFPTSIVEAVAHHHCPSHAIAPEFAPLTAVHAANALLHEALTGEEPALDTAHLKNIGRHERVPKWRDLAEAQVKTEQRKEMD